MDIVNGKVVVTHRDLSVIESVLTAEVQNHNGEPTSHFDDVCTLQDEAQRTIEKLNSAPEEIEYKCQATPMQFGDGSKDGDGEYAETECGKPSSLMVKYEQREWPMAYGTVQLCDEHRKVIWGGLERLFYMG
jgi:hypothetical protein